MKGFSTAEATACSLLREDEISKQHEEDADDEADVEVDRRPALHALPSRRLLAAAQRCNLVAAAGSRNEQKGRAVTVRVALTLLLVGIGILIIFEKRGQRGLRAKSTLFAVRWRAFDLTRSLDWFIYLIGYISSELNASLVYGYYTQR